MVPKKSVIRMKEYIPPKEGRRDKLNLDFNENTVGASPKVVEALRGITNKGLSLYPEYEKLLPVLAGEIGISEKMIKLTNGADDAIKSIIDCYLDKDDKIMIPIPTFDMFRFYSELAGAMIKDVLYEDDLSFPTERLIQNIEPDTRIIVVVNPNNPTGTAVTLEEIMMIATVAKDSLILVDEAYIDFYKETALPLIEHFKNIVIVRTFSKAYGLAGLRLGYIIADEKIISDISRSSSPYNVNSMATIAGTAAIKDKGYVKDYVDEIIANKGYMKKRLESMGLFVYPSVANFLVVKFGERCDLICDGLKRKGILIRNRTKDPLLEGCARITIGSREQCDSLLKALIPMMFDSFLFDMDGVLADVTSSYRVATKETAEYFLGKRIDLAMIQQLKEEGGFNNDWVLTQEIIKRNGLEISFERVKEKFQEIYKGDDFDGLIQEEPLLIDMQLLEKLRPDFNLGVVTGRPKEEAVFFLENNDLTQLFDDLVAKEDVGKREKPDPYGLTLGFDRIRQSKDSLVNRAVYFGDSVDDMVAAKACGMFAIGVIPPGIKDSGKLKDALEKNGADLILYNINEIEGLL